ncbi:HlyD family secretion protein [Shewanella sp. NIFS-20-20]|uniref:HlyD family secretion protein n=1 Tax=Shewanella sp. NIFS-20-20 TaxID=2853806 RepID=UPI001C48DA47|nr:HlyD family efflux transporter periplasmic adaptor subunit [Shewanella sp. NIFS-20-20]MBV7317108.1 HlyD family efflux transporter periplasmic adaptor subunit [Shewanella sp. NIFS-20-20]
MWRSYLWCAVLLASAPLCAESLLLTGQIASIKAQKMSVPKAGDAWRYQVQWLMAEGDVAKVGQSVVIFDKSQVANQIEQLQAALLRVNAEEKSSANQLQAAVLQAEFNEKQARLNREKAALDAAIPVDFIAAKDYADHQFALLKADAELEKMQQALDDAHQSLRGNLHKLAIDKRKAEVELAKALKDLDSLDLKAALEGPVIYAQVTNQDRKVQVGDTVQIGQHVVTIPAMEDLQITAFVNEVDIDKLALGTSAELRLDADLTQPFQAKISQISRQGVVLPGWGQSVWFEVALSITEPVLKLQPGMSVQIQIEVS